MRPKDLGALILLGALWGGSFLFIRVAVPALGPFVLMELRVGLASLALTLYAVAASRQPKLRARWREFLIIGTVNAAIPFSLIAAAEINLTASLAAILNSTTVLFTAVVAALWMGEALTARKVVGVVSGIGELSDAAVAADALAAALSAVYVQRTVAGQRHATTAIEQLSNATKAMPHTA